MINYTLPQDWIRYDRLAIADRLIAAKATLLSLESIPYQKRWAVRIKPSYVILIT